MIRTTFLAMTVMSLLLFALPCILWLIGWLIGLCFGLHLPFGPFGWTGLGLVVLFWAVMLYGIYIGRWQLEVNRQEFRSAEVPEALDGYKIIHISDLHLSTFDDKPEALKRIVESINAEEPDLVCFTGDLVTFGYEEAAPYRDILRGLKAKDGICSVLGNHDFLIYRRGFSNENERLAAVEALANYERDSLGWQLLRNDHYQPREGLSIVGVDNASCTGQQGFHTLYAADLGKAMKGTNGMRILLSHDPSHWRAEVAGKEAIPLTLSGHTHAGQVRLFGWPLSAVSFKDNEGWYACGEQKLYINRGLGCTLPMRLGCPAEITLIELKKF